MANTERKIVRGVRTETKTFVPGMEDELDAVLSKSDVKRLTEKGYIEGSWSGKGKEPAEAKAEK